MNLKPNNGNDDDLKLDPTHEGPLLRQFSNPEQHQPNRQFGSVQSVDLNNEYENDIGPPGPLGKWGEIYPVPALLSVTLIAWLFVTFFGSLTWIVIPNFWTPLFVVATTLMIVLRQTGDQYVDSIIQWDLAIVLGAIAGAFSSMISGLFFEQWLSVSINRPITVNPSSSYVPILFHITMCIVTEILSIALISIEMASGILNRQRIEFDSSARMHLEVAGRYPLYIYGSAYLYICVAPILNISSENNNAYVQPVQVMYWAVGEQCCGNPSSESTQSYSCGGWGPNLTWKHATILESTPYYDRAVQSALRKAKDLKSSDDVRFVMLDQDPILHQSYRVHISLIGLLVPAISSCVLVLLLA